MASKPLDVDIPLHSPPSATLPGASCTPAKVAVSEPQTDEDTQNASLKPMLRLSGSPFLASDPQAAQWRLFLAQRRPRDAALSVRKWLREAARAEGAAPGMRFKAGPHALLGS